MKTVNTEPQKIRREKKKRKKIGLALGNGGAKGLVHIGVIKALVKNNIPIDYIAGTSAGAIIGGAYAAKKNIDSIEQKIYSLTKVEFVKIFLDPSFKKGIIKGANFSAYLRSQTGDINIEETQVPFKAVATDVETGKPFILEKGNLVKAIRASSAFPLIFSPVSINGHLLIDGGVSIPVPVGVVKEMGADIVIAVNLNNITLNLQNKKASTLNILRVSLDLLLRRLADIEAERADIVIEPQLEPIPWTQVLKGRRIIEEGESLMAEKIPELIKLINS